MIDYSFQWRAVDAACQALVAGRNLAVVSPTGSGKSYMQGELLRRRQGDGYRHYQTTPSLSVSLGILTKLSAPEDILRLSEARQQFECEARGIFTVKRLYNLLMSGAVLPPDSIAHDEGHHTVDNTHVVVDALCSCPSVMFTATYYRGTPEETRKLRDRWGEPHVALTLRRAVDSGVISRPDFSCWPLLNDDMIEVSNGEFVVRQLDSAIQELLPDLVQRMRPLCATGFWDRPTTVVCPSVASCLAVTEAMNAYNLPAVSVTGETRGREAIFRSVVAMENALVQVRVVGEGVDLPLRLMIDLAPTLSPVLWMQRVGRIARPTICRPDYIACNHNLTRHAYLWAGVIPPSQVRDAQKAWGEDYKPTRRSLCRALGLEGFGRFKVSLVPLSDGSDASLYTLQTPDGMHQYAALLHPTMADPWFFEKTNTAGTEKATFTRGEHTIEYTKKLYGPWHRVDQIPSLEGYVTTKPSPLTPKQAAWWKRSARSRGLAEEHSPDSREFQALPILFDARLKFKLEA